MWHGEEQGMKCPSLSLWFPGPAASVSYVFFFFFSPWFVHPSWWQKFLSRHIQDIPEVGRLNYATSEVYVMHDKRPLHYFVCLISLVVIKEKVLNLSNFQQQLWLLKVTERERFWLITKGIGLWHFLPKSHGGNIFWKVVWKFPDTSCSFPTHTPQWPSKWLMPAVSRSQSPSTHRWRNLHYAHLTMTT